VSGTDKTGSREKVEKKKKSCFVVFPGKTLSPSQT
jgi:hypothetical protein